MTNENLAKIVVMGMIFTLLCALLQAEFSPYGFGRQLSFYEHYEREVQNDKEAFLFCLFGYAYQPDSFDSLGKRREATQTGRSEK